MRRLFFALVLSLTAFASVQAAAVRFRIECGSYGEVCGPVGTLQQDGPAYDLDLSPAQYTLAYVSDNFVMTAMNADRDSPSSPFSLVIYPEEGPFVTFPWPGNRLGYIISWDFPLSTGDAVTVALPPAEVAEPGTTALLLGGLGVLGWLGRRRGAGQGSAP